MRKDEVNAGGMVVAAVFALIGTLGYFLTADRLVDLNWLWLATFVASLFTLSGAVVNFDPKRILK